MKQIKNVWLVIIGCFFIMTAATISCSKKDSTPPPVVPKATITSFTPTSAYSGDTVTITGTNFTGATAVSFGGTPAAAFTVVNATTVKAKVGSGATGSITVVTPGNTATLAGFTYNSGLPPVDGYLSSNEIETASLIAHWPFDGNTTESVHSANPVLTGGAQTFIPGKIGQAVHLEAGWLTYGPEATSAGADNTTFASNDTLQNGFTLSLWTQAPETDPLEPKGLTNLFQLSSPNIPNWPLLGIAYRKHTTDSSFDFDGGISNVDGTGPHLSYAGAFKEPAFRDTLSWAFLAMTFDATDKSLKYYANGALVNTINLTSAGGVPFPDANASLLIIAPNYATIGSFEGLDRTPGDLANAIPGFMQDKITGNIDDIRFFNKTLTTTQINDLFVLGNQGR